MSRNVGAQSPVVRVWSTDIVKRQYELAPDEDVRNQEHLKQHYNEYLNEPFHDEVPLYESIGENEKAPDIITNKEPRARFSKEQFDAYLTEAPKIGISKKSITLSGTDTGSLRITNKGKKLVKLKFNATNGNKALNFSPSVLIVRPGQAENINISHSKSVAGNYKVNVLSHVLEGEPSRKAASFSVVTVPGKKLKRTIQKHKSLSKKRAKVKWDRVGHKIVFRNVGSIASRFTDISICISKTCTESPDILLSAGATKELLAPSSASVKLTQIVGKSRKSGVIEPVN